MTVSSKKNLAILGAGIAGLTAGLELQRAGYNVTIYEARARTGGRIHTLRINGLIVESGPEFIHGRLRQTMALLKKYKIEFDAIHGKMYQEENGMFTEIHEMTERWDLLLDRMKHLTVDMTLLDFLDTHFPGTDFTQLRTEAIRYAEGFDLADPAFASTMSLFKEWKDESSEQYRIPSGYSELVHAMEKDFLQNGGKIFLNQAVKSLTLEKNEIRLNTESSFSANHDRVLITLPISLLNQMKQGSQMWEEGEHTAKEGFIFNIIPASEKIQLAIGKIGFGTVIKIVLIWKQNFWKTIIPEAQFIFTPGFIPTWWTQFPADSPMLTGWLGGPNAEMNASQPDNELLIKVLKQLSEIFSIPMAKLKEQLMAHRIFNWKHEPWTRGAYSYSGIESANARTICREPLDGRVYLSGEAFYEGPYPGTVEAAIISGLQSGRDLIENEHTAGRR